MFFGLFSKSKKESIHDDYVSKTVFDHILEEVMLAVINCWNSTNVFTTKDTFFTRLGVMPYNREDDRTMAKLIKQRMQEIVKEDKKGAKNNPKVKKIEAND